MSGGHLRRWAAVPRCSTGGAAARPGRGGYNNTTHHNNKHPAGQPAAGLKLKQDLFEAAVAAYLTARWLEGFPAPAALSSPASQPDNKEKLFKTVAAQLTDGNGNIYFYFYFLFSFSFTSC